MQFISFESTIKLNIRNEETFLDFHSWLKDRFVDLYASIS